MLNEQLALNQKQSVELHTMLKQVKQQDVAQEYLQRQVMQHIKEKHEIQKRLEEVEAVYRDISEKYEVVKREHSAVLENNKLLEKKARDLA